MRETRFLPFSVVFVLAFTTLFPYDSHSQKLEKMPKDLEKDFALSSLPPHLRSGATVYLLDPTKGYYIEKKGNNGFVCFVARMEWEWGIFPTDYAVPISFDAAGNKAIFPAYRDAELMRASGKYTAQQVKAIVIDRIKKGIYKAPARPGISYMLAPVMRSYVNDPGDNKLASMNMPHYMFYAPYMNDKDIGGQLGKGPFIGNTGNVVLGDRKGPFGYIIVSAGETRKAEIMAENKNLLTRLIAYKAYFNTEDMNGMKMP